MPHAEEAPTRRRPWLPPLVMWALALAAIGAVQVFGRDGPLRDLLIGPIDVLGFQFLAAVATALLVGTALWLTASASSRPPAPGWTRFAASALQLGITTVALLAAYPVLVVGALCFGDDYRTIGVIDGREVIVTQGIGLGQFPIRVGLRDGPFVRFSSVVYTNGDTAFGRIRFRVSETPAGLMVTFPESMNGPLVLPRS